MNKIVISTLLLTAIFLGRASVAMAQDAPLLTVTGDAIDHEVTYDQAALMALPVTTIETSTIWTDGVHSFTGVSLADLTSDLGLENGTIKATAVNDYAVEIPMEDAVDGGAIVAYFMDGEEMTLRDKGPLWIVYPYDSDTSYQTEVIYARSIWQLDRLDIAQ